MRTPAEAQRRLEAANPVISASTKPAAAWSSAVLLERIDKRSGDMQTQEKPIIEKSPKKRTRRRNLALALGAAVIVAAVGVSAWLVTDESSDVASSDPAAVLADYLEVWNAEDGEAVMVFYAEDAVFENHPLHGVATGKSEILDIEVSMDRLQGSTGTMEYVNMEVSGDTVTFDNISHDSHGLCFSSAGSKATIENDLITLIVWGDNTADLC